MAALRGYITDEGLAEGMFRHAVEACPGGMSLMRGDDAKVSQDKTRWSSTNYRNEAIAVLLGFIYIGFIVAVSL